MIVGVVKEIKDSEHRVALTPAGAEALAAAGHTVLVQAGAGAGSGLDDAAYAAAGARLAPDAATVWREAELLLKVKEPLPPEYAYLHAGQLLFTYLHLAADERLTRELLRRRVTAIGYETARLADGRLPLLAPMSEVAGRLAVQIGAHYLERPAGGSGTLLGGVPGVAPGRIAILGGGTVGTSAAQVGLGMGAEVVVFDTNLDRLRYLDQVLHGRLWTVAATRTAIAEQLPTTDLLIGAILVPGARAPRLVDPALVARMRSGSVIVDVAIDQGGCIETARLTSHSEPTYRASGVIHYAVPNMPGAVPRTSTFALTNATLPYAVRLAEHGFDQTVAELPELAPGVNTHAGAVTHVGVAAAFGLPFAPLERAEVRDGRGAGAAQRP